MKKSEIIAKLEELEIVHNPTDKKDVLAALLPVSDDEDDQEEDEEDQDTDEGENTPPVPTASKPKHYEITAKYKGNDEEGNMTWLEYHSEGKTLAEALETLNFPPRINAQIRVIVKAGEKEVELSFAPHKWNPIVESKDAKALGNLIGM